MRQSLFHGMRCAGLVGRALRDLRGLPGSAIFSAEYYAMMKPRNHQSGFTLLETLLTICLLGLLLVGMYQLFDSWAQRAVNRTAATDTMRLQHAAEDYTLANFATFKASPPGVFTEISVADMKTGTYLPFGYEPRNSYRQAMRVFRRNLVVTRLNKDGTVALDASGQPLKITTIEVLTIADNPSTGTIRVGNRRLLDAAGAGGPKMGVSSEIVRAGSSFSGLVTSVFNDWSVDRSALAAAGYTATPDAAGGYLAAYGLVSGEPTDPNDHWLYRVDVEGRPELNRMAANLNMNAHKLQNVGTFVGDKITVTGDATFRGVTQGVSSETAQGMTVEQALRVDSPGESRINMKSNNATCSLADAGGGNRTIVGNGCSISGGELQVIAENQVDTLSGAVVAPPGDALMDVTALTANGSVITDFTNVADTTDSAGISTFNTVDGDDMNINTTLLAPTTNVTGDTVNTIQYQASGMGVTNGATVGNQMVAARVSPGMTHTFKTPQMTLGNAAELTGNLIANNATATETLYLDNATGGYHDNVLNRDVVCTPYGGRTYCEPVGTTYWNGGTYREECSLTGTGYQCNHYRIQLGNWVFLGYCNHTRAVGASGQAYHTSSCS